MTHLRKKMLEELQRRNYSEGTTRAYLSRTQLHSSAHHCHRLPSSLLIENASKHTGTFRVLPRGISDQG